MNSLKSIKILIQKLTQDEIKSLFKYLSFNSDNNKTELKSIQLINLLLEENSYSTNEIQNKIYGKLNYTAYSKLLNRLKQKIFEILTFDSNISSDQYSNRNKVLLLLRKKLLQADILQLKGLRKDVIPIYNFIIKKSKQFELYDLQVQALNSKLRVQSINSKIDFFKKGNEEIKYAEACFEALKHSNNIYREVANLISNSSTFNSYEKELIKSINKLDEYYHIYKSPTIGFYFNTLSAESFQNRSNFKKAEECLQNVQNILLSNESAYTENRFGNNLINISNNNIYLGKFELAIDFGIKSKFYFKNLPFTLKIVDEILFYSYFYNQDYDNCNLLINKMNAIYENDELRNKFIYFESCLLFITERYDESISKLMDCIEIDKDKEGWNINRRILLILNRIELKDYESVDLQIQNLERFIKRMSKSKNVRLRYKIILRILIKLVQINYDYLSVYKNKNKYFKLLESEEIEYKWEIKSPELIIFTDWFNSKISSTKLNQSKSKSRSRVYLNN